jgi:hypothetical protein
MRVLFREDQQDAAARLGAVLHGESEEAANRWLTDDHKRVAMNRNEPQ